MTSPTHWMGEMRPRQYRRQSVSALERELIVGRKGSYFSVITVRLLEPTPEYPRLVVHIGLTNGNRSSYTQVKPEELRLIIDSLEKWYSEILPLVPNLEQKANIFLTEQMKYQANIEAVRQIMSQVGDQNESTT